jgi:hypothetical protein
MSELSRDPAIKLFGRTIPLYDAQPNLTEPEKVGAYRILCICIGGCMQLSFKNFHFLIKEKILYNLHRSVYFVFCG